VKEVGEGSRRLAELPIGARLKLLGPLGNSFALPPPGVAAALVAGGCGWAGLGMLARELRRLGHPAYAFIGAQTADALPVKTAEAPTEAASFIEGLPDVCLTSAELEALGVIVALAAEAGGKLYGGLVTDLLEAFLRKRGREGVCIYACGPRAMLARVAELSLAHGAPCQVAMEERMACGMGVCNSCVVEVRLPEGKLGHKKLCTDGPVLDADEVVWAKDKDP
jgi:dihydroorotate dehydrogenase electron transfer subunit